MARGLPLSPVPASGSRASDAMRAGRLRWWIVGIGVLALAALAVSSAFDVWRSYHQNISAIHRELDNTAKTLAEQAEGSVQLADLLLRETAAWYQNERPGSGSAADAKLAARAAGLPQVREVRIIDEHGTPRVSSRLLPGDDVPLSDRAYFIAQRDNPRLGVVLSNPLITQIEHRPAVIMSRRLEKPDGNFDGIVQAVIDLEEFQRVYEAIDLGRGSAIHLLRADGTMIVRQPPIPGIVGRKFPEMIATPADPDGLVLHTIDQRPRFVGIAHVGAFPLVLTVSREKNVALEDWRDEAWHVAVRTLILLLLGSAAIGGLVYQLRRVEIGEQALRQSEERYALAMEGANEGHFDWNFEPGAVSFLSPQMKLLHGRSADAPVTTRQAWMSTLDVHTDDRARLEAAARDHLEGRSDRYEVEYRVRQADGLWHWLQVRGRCTRDASGQVHRFAGSAIDITARKSAEAEQDRLERELRQSQKLEAMGTLAGGIAHDFNNILGAILGYGELAQKAAPEGGVLRRYLDNVMQAGGRAKALVERILAFSRSGLGERGPINVQAVIAETVALLAASLPPNVRLEQRLDAGDAAIVGDATQLHQVAMNLGSNALQAMEHGGILAVMLDRAEVTLDRAISHGKLRAGAYVRLRVSDTGSGIPQQVLDRMFDPFFTTKGVGEGTGLGLSLVHGIVADLGGAIDVRTSLGQGTAFTIWLPMSGEAAAPATEIATLPHGHGETVMIVDDEKSLVALSEEMLAELGYEPLGFNSSVAALEAFRASPQRFDIVITDETMPDLIGSALADKLREIRPDIPIVLMSGYAGTHVLERARAAGISEVLRKPLQGKDIAECLGRVLRSVEAARMVPS